MFRAFARFDRSKKDIIEGVNALDKNTLSILGLNADQYVRVWDTLPLIGSDWQADSLRLRNQKHTLHRVAVRGLPLPENMDKSVRKAARDFRLFFWGIGMPALALIFLMGSVNISKWIAEVTTISSVYWFSAMALAIGVAFFLPLDKFRKWPKIEGQS